MKKITLLLSGLISSLAVFAQTLPNAGFETWVNNTETGTVYEVPQGWGTGDLIEEIFDTTYTAVTVSKSTQSHSGTYAVKMENVVSNGDTVTALIYSVQSVVELLTNAFSGQAFGFPYNSRPANLQGYYKFNPIGNDEAYFYVQMTKWNTVTNSRDTIISNLEYVITSNASTYTMFNIPINYVSGENPDTVFISVEITGGAPSYSTPHPGSTFYLDDLAFSGTVTSINELSTLSKVQLYPNPFSTNAKITIDPTIELNNASITIVDVVGKKVQELSNIRNHEVTIERQDLPSGLYFYKVSNNNTEIANDRFIIK